MSPERPPRWARTLLRRLVPGDYGSELLADLEEGFRSRTERWGRLRATLWYLGQLARPDTFRLARLLRKRRRPGGPTETGNGRRRGATMRGRGRAGSWPGALRDDLGYALRSVLRNPGYATFACLTLALGIGATTAIFSGVESVILQPLPYEAADRMYMLFRPAGEGALLGPRPEQVPEWQSQRDLFETVEWVGVTGKTLTGRGPAEGLRVGLIRSEMLKVLGIEPALGRPFRPEEARGDGARVVLLSHGLWQTRFGGDPGVLGRSVRLDGQPWTVVGVLAPRTPFPYGFRTDMDLWAPFPDARAERGASVVAVAAEGVTREEIQTRLDLLEERAVERGEAASDWSGREISVTGQIGSTVREPLRILMAAVGLLFLIACVNVANLLVSRATLRRRETAVRAALGAPRGRLARQLLLESLLLAAGGAVAGLAMAYGGLEAMQALRPDDLAVLDGVRVNRRVLLFTAGVGTLAGILFGTLPAWRGSRAEGVTALRSGSRVEGKGVVSRRFRWVLVAGEVALSFALLVGSVMAVRALGELQGRDPGFRAEDLLVVRATLPSWKYAEPAAGREVFEPLRERIEGLAGVARTSLSNGVPPSVGLWIGTPQAEGSPPASEHNLLFGPAVDARYGETLGIRMVAGRWFTPEEVRNEAPVTILGRTAAREIFGHEAPVGGRMRIDDGEWRTVVGVAPDLAMLGLDVGPHGEMQHFRPRSGGSREVAIAVRLAPGADAGAVLGAVRSLLRAREPDVLLGTAAPVERLLRDSVSRERFTSALLTIFAVLAVVLAAVGLYGVVSQVVGQRTREIGIRISLGADGGRIRRLVLRGGVGATGAGIVLGIGLAVAGFRVLSSQLFGLQEGSGGPASYAGAAGLLAAVTLAACWLPARRAARVDPVEALRSD